MNKNKGETYELSAIPASALYQAIKAANIPKYPPAWFNPRLIFPSASAYRCAKESIRNAISRKRKREKKATVDFNVQIRSRKVKMNQPAR